MLESDNLLLWLESFEWDLYNWYGELNFYIDFLGDNVQLMYLEYFLFYSINGGWN